MHFGHFLFGLAQLFSFFNLKSLSGTAVIIVFIVVLLHRIIFCELEAGRSVRVNGFQV